MSSSFAAIRNGGIHASSGPARIDTPPADGFPIGPSRIEPEGIRDRQRKLLARVSVRISGKEHEGEHNAYLKYALDEAFDLDEKLDRAKSLLKEASKCLTGQADQILQYKIDEFVAHN